MGFGPGLMSGGSSAVEQWTVKCASAAIHWSGVQISLPGFFLLFKKEKIFEKNKKTYNTRDSLVVPYQSTDRAQRCLTSQFGWDAVLSPWYDRMTRPLQRRGTPVVIFFFGPAKNQKHFFFFFVFSRPWALLAILFQSVTSSINTKCRCGLPKFDSKILIT